MPPLHYLNDHHHPMADDEDDETAFFLPLDHRRWSDASEVSAYCIHPNDQALQRHEYRPLQPKKVAVIGNGASSIVCASTLRQDGHQVTVLASSSLRDDCSEHSCHPDFLPQDQRSSSRSSNYLRACANYFGVTIKEKTNVVDMTEKFGGWVLSYRSCTRGDGSGQKLPLESNEYFDFVVIAEDTPYVRSASSTTRFQEQYVLPLLAGVVWMLRLLFPLWTVAPPTAEKAKVPHFIPTKYHEAAQSKSKFFRRILSSEISRVAFLGGLQNGGSVHLASVWLSTVLYEEMVLPTVGLRSYGEDQPQVNLRYNDLLMKDLGLDPQRKRSGWEEMFMLYTPSDYQGILRQVQERRRVSEQEGWAVPLRPTSGNL